MQKQSATAQVTDRLITAIAVGVYSPGQQLPPERELATLLSVSRVTLRQALAHVVGLGLLESRRGRGGGTFVAQRSWQDVAPDAVERTLESQLPVMATLFDYRNLVEGMIAQAAAQRCTPDQAAELRQVMDEFAQASTPEQARECDKRLHGAVAAIPGNPYLTTLSAQLTTAATLGFSSEPYTQEFYARALGEHRLLVDRIVSGDAVGAAEAATRHFDLTAVALHAGLEAAKRR